MRKLVLLLSVGIAGCQSYQPSPLDLRAHADAWANRNPASPAVAAYTARLAGKSAQAVEGGTAAFDPSDGLTLVEARTVSLFFNPQLRAARLKARVPAVGATEAGRWADPVLQVDAERIVQSVSHPWVIGGMVNITIPLSGRLGLERELAFAEADTARMEALLEEQRVLGELDVAWTELRLTDERMELIRLFLTDLDELASQADRLRAAAELSPIEAGLFKVEQIRRRVEFQYLSARRGEQEFTVKALLGLTPEASVRLTPSLPALSIEPSDSASRRQRLATEHPRIRFAQAQYAVAERTLELEVRRQYPDLTLGGGYGKDEGTNRILGGIGLPIPLFNANRKAIAEARANRDAARASSEATYEGLIASLSRAEALLTAARTRRESLARDLAPIVDEQLKSARNLGRIGNVSTVAVFETVTRAHATRLDLLDATAAEASALNELTALLRPVQGVEPQTQEQP